MPEKYFAYVDETGDLGDLSVSPKASPHFGMAAILFPASAAGDVRRMITDLKGEFRVPHDAVSRPYLETTLPTQKSLPMELLDSLQWVAATKYRESDVADLFAGCLNEALRPGRYGHVEGRYLRTVWPRVRGVENCTNASNYCAVPLGFMAMPNYKVISPGWFPCPDCPKIK